METSVTQPAVGDTASANSPFPTLTQRLRWLSPAGAVLAMIGLAGAVGWLMPGRVRVESDPPGAVVFVDGKHIGRTPLLLSSWGAETWALRLEAAGHVPWAGGARLEPRSFARIFASLLPLPGSLTIESEPPGAFVRLDGRDTGVTPLRVAALAAGRHGISLSAPDHEEWVGELDIPPGGHRARKIALRPLPARLLVLTHVEGGVLSIDGLYRGRTPIEVESQAGERVVRIEAEGYQPWETVVRLLPNQASTLDLVLQRPWPHTELGERVFPVAIIVENLPEARPQTGLDRADIVYEVLTEGGITRFLALYATQDADSVGPVRSARHYFVNWAREYGAAMIHFGASPRGYAALSATRTPSLDGILSTRGFWRIRGRYAPHNAYTSIPAAREVFAGRAPQPGSFGGLQFKNTALRQSGPSAPHAVVKYGRWSYRVDWTYDPRENAYARSMDGSAHADAQSGDQIHASNVLVQWVNSWAIPGDQMGRIDLAQLGTGRLVALIDGVAIEGHWSKSSLEAATEYRDAEGNPITLNTGPTWIQIVPADGSLGL